MTFPRSKFGSRGYLSYIHDIEKIKIKVMLNINQEFISKDQIRQQAPSIFTTQGAPGTSEKVCSHSYRQNY